MRIIGIDPGMTGAWAWIDGPRSGVYDLPIIRDAKNGWIDGMQFLINLRDHQAPDMHAYVERIHPMPQNGSRATFSQGCTFGSIMAVLQIAGIPVTLVPPAQWKNKLGLSKDKNASLHKARLLFPQLELHRMRDHNRAEALLIAYSQRQQHETR